MLVWAPSYLLLTFKRQWLTQRCLEQSRLQVTVISLALLPSSISYQGSQTRPRCRPWAVVGLDPKSKQVPRSIWGKMNKKWGHTFSAFTALQTGQGQRAQLPRDREPDSACCSQMGPNIK